MHYKSKLKPKPMKRFANQLLVIVALEFCSHDSFARHIKNSMQQALDKKQVTAKAVCKGGLELNYTLTNTLKDSLSVVLPPGWRFNSNAGKSDYQDILVTKQELFVLKPKETKTFFIKGYCCELSKSGPIEGVPYTVGKLADSSLVSLARYLNVNRTARRYL